MITFECLRDYSKCSMKNELKVGNSECEGPLRIYSRSSGDSSLDVGKMIVAWMRAVEMEMEIKE